MEKVIATFSRPRYAIERLVNGEWVFVKAMDREFDAKVLAEKTCEKYDQDTRVVDRG